MEHFVAVRLRAGSLCVPTKFIVIDLAHSTVLLGDSGGTQTRLRHSRLLCDP